MPNPKQRQRAGHKSKHLVVASARQRQQGSDFWDIVSEMAPAVLIPTLTAQESLVASPVVSATIDTLVGALVLTLGEIFKLPSLLLIKGFNLFGGFECPMFPVSIQSVDQRQGKIAHALVFLPSGYEDDPDVDLKVVWVRSSWNSRDLDLVESLVIESLAALAGEWIIPNEDVFEF